MAPPPEKALRRAALKRLQANAVYGQSSKMARQRRDHGQATPGLAPFKDLKSGGGVIEETTKRELWAACARRVASKELAEQGARLEENEARRVRYAGGRERKKVGLDGETAESAATGCCCLPNSTNSG